MRSNQQTPVQNSHKEETPGRMKLDQADRKNLRDKLELCIDPLDTTKLSDRLVNVVTGQITNYATVNPDKAIQLEKQQRNKFEQNWPKGFYRSIPKVVHTMVTTRKTCQGWGTQCHQHRGSICSNSEPTQHLSRHGPDYSDVLRIVSSSYGILR